MPVIFSIEIIVKDNLIMKPDLPSTTYPNNQNLFANWLYGTSNL